MAEDAMSNRADFDILGKPIFWTEGAEERDTIPAPPVPSVNPVAELRRQVDESAVAVRRVTSLGDQRYVGMQSMGFWFDDVTPHMDSDDACAWLSAARAAITHGSVPPEFCINRHLKTTTGLCGHCLRGTK
jgi:hypothetical protein